MGELRVGLLAERLGTAAGGTEVYERALLATLFAEAQATAPDIAPVTILAYKEGLELLPPELRPACRVLWPTGKLGSLIAVWHEARRSRLNLLHSLFITPLVNRRLPLVVTVHDLSFVHYPEFFPPLLTRRLKLMLAWTVRRADIIVTVSEHTRQDLLNMTRAEPSRVYAVPSGIDASFAKVPLPPDPQALLARYGIRRPFILYAGRLQPRKNVARLVEAYEILRRAGDFDGQLVLMGEDRKFLWRGPQARIDRSPYRQDIIQTGFIPYELVPAFYSQASAFAFVSLYEGFGFPVLEAMARKVPVVCSNTTSLPEVAGDAALLVNPQDAAQIAAALSRLIHDENLRQELIAKGLARVPQFSWRRTVSRLFEIYRRLAP